MNNFLSVENDGFSEYVIERSKFLSYVTRADDEKAAKTFIEKIRKENSLATHNCYAYIVGNLGEYQKYSDDGEPSGTAGLPLLEALKKSGLKNVCLVCSRYFGGVKLGAGGLTRAYLKSGLTAIENATVKEFEVSALVSFSLTYNEYYDFLKFPFDKKEVKSSDFNEKVDLSIFVPFSLCDRFCKEICDFLNKSVDFSVEKDGFRSF